MDCIEWFADRIAELEKENVELRNNYEDYKVMAEERINELEQKYSKQADDFENMKAGLESEITNLKTQIHKMKCCANCGNNHDCQLKGCRCNNHIGYPFWKVM
jgi:chromosome segregation ATPase